MWQTYIHHGLELLRLVYAISPMAEGKVGGATNSNATHSAVAVGTGGCALYYTYENLFLMKRNEKKSSYKNIPSSQTSR